MTADRERVTRRKADQLICQTLGFHHAVLEFLQGREADFDEILHRIKQSSANLGRRESDRRLGHDFDDALERIVGLLKESAKIEESPRRVWLRKAMSEDKSEFPAGTVKVGWEIKPPRVGKRYCLCMDDGKMFRTSRVESIGVDHFRTRHSLYEIAAIRQYPSPSYDKTAIGRPKGYPMSISIMTEE